MTLEEIKAAVRSGQVVVWQNPGYRVIEDKLGQWLIQCTFNGHCWGLTWADGVTMNESPGAFRVLHEVEECAP